MHIVMVGNPFDGMTAYGPFETSEDADDFAASLDDYFWIIELNEPD